MTYFPVCRSGPVLIIRLTEALPVVPTTNLLVLADSNHHIIGSGPKNLNLSNVLHTITLNFLLIRCESLFEKNTAD